MECLLSIFFLKLSSAASTAAVDQSMFWQEGSPQNRPVTSAAREALLRGMPVLSFMRHLTLVYTNGFTAGITIFCKETLKAVAAVRMALPHYVALSSKLSVTLKATKVLHVPTATLCLRALIGKYDLAYKRRKNVLWTN